MKARILVLVLTCAVVWGASATVEATSARADTPDPATAIHITPVIVDDEQSTPFVGFEWNWDQDSNLVVAITGADPAGTITVRWLYVATDGSQGTGGSVTGPYARADGTATVTVAARHFTGDHSKYEVVATQTAAAEKIVGDGAQLMPIWDGDYQNSFCGPGKEGIVGWFSISRLRLDYGLYECHHTDGWSNDDFITSVCDGCTNEAYWEMPQSGLPVPHDVWAWRRV